MDLTRNIPVIEVLAGKILTQRYVIIRHWGKQFGAFDGNAEEEKNWADAICDVVIGC
jgi:glutathione S-transferase